MIARRVGEARNPPFSQKKGRVSGPAPQPALRLTDRPYAAAFSICSVHLPIDAAPFILAR
jgi:hypothetical protein